MWKLDNQILNQVILLIYMDEAPLQQALHSQRLLLSHLKVVAIVYWEITV